MNYDLARHYHGEPIGLGAPSTPAECDEMLREFERRCGRKVIVSEHIYNVYKAAGGDVSLLQINRPIPTS